MEKTLYNLIEVFQGKVVRIPAFQRGYSWQKRQLEALWKDVMNIEPEYETRLHFTGTLVFERVQTLSNGWKKEISKSDLAKLELIPYSLVDGQQRLTSAIILLFELLKCTKQIYSEALNDKSNIISKILLKKIESETKYLFGYEKDTPSHYHLLRNIFEDETITIEEPETIYTKNLDFSKEYFADKVSSFNDRTRSRLIHIILYQLKFSQLVLDESEIDISMVFETLNFRGKPLSSLEILKNRILFLLSRNNNIRSKVKSKGKVVETWLNIYKYLGKLNEEWIKEDEFLHSFWLIYFNNDNRIKGSFTNQNCQDDIFDNRFPITNQRENTLDPNELKRFLRCIDLSIRCFFYLNNPNELENIRDDEPDAIKILDNENIINYISKIKELRNGERPSKNIICSYVVSKKYSQIQLLDILQQLERHNFLVYNLYGRKSDTNIVKFDTNTNKIYRENRHDKTIRELKDMVFKYTRNDKDIVKYVHYSREENQGFYDWSGIDYFLKEYERFKMSNDCSYYMTIKGYRKTKLFDRQSRRNFKNIFNDSTTKKYYENTLGNIFLSQKDRYNKTYDELKMRVSEDGTISERELLESSINKEFLYKRGLKLFMFLNKRWNASVKLHDHDLMREILFKIKPKVERQQVTSDDHSIG